VHERCVRREFHGSSACRHSFFVQACTGRNNGQHPVRDVDLRKALYGRTGLRQGRLQITDNFWQTRGLRGSRNIAAGRARDAADELRAALELNRWNNWFGGIEALYLYYAGDLPAALTEARAAVLRSPEVDISHRMLSVVASGAGLHEEAVAAGRRAMELSPDTPLVHAALACALARGGMLEEAMDLVRLIEARCIAAPCPSLATAYLALGQRDRAIDVIVRAREAGSPQFIYVFVDPRLAELTGDPDFERLRPVNKPAPR
jgi:tetratricopeptide (TPR) repeat protein